MFGNRSRRVFLMGNHFEELLEIYLLKLKILYDPSNSTLKY